MSDPDPLTSFLKFYLYTSNDNKIIGGLVFVLFAFFEREGGCPPKFMFRSQRSKVGGSPHFIIVEHIVTEIVSPLKFSSLEVRYL